MVLNSNKIYYTYKDVTILPSVLSSIEHRSECSTHCENGLLPLFTSPMDTVVNEKIIHCSIINQSYLYCLGQ